MIRMKKSRYFQKNMILSSCIQANQNQTSGLKVWKSGGSNTFDGTGFAFNSAKIWRGQMPPWPPDFADPEMKLGAIQQLCGQKEEGGGSVEKMGHMTNDR